MENRCRWILTRITLAELTALLVIAGHCMVCGCLRSSGFDPVHIQHGAFRASRASDTKCQRCPKYQENPDFTLVENKSESFGQQFRSVEKYFKQRLQSIYSWGTSDPSSLHQNISKHSSLEFYPEEATLIDETSFKESFARTLFKTGVQSIVI
jgi:hypothetical protein